MSWAEECWRAATASPCAHLSVGTLSKLWHQMSGRHAADWARCRGPLNAAILSLQRLSWRMVGPFTWLTDQNVEVSPLKCSPKLIADMMRDALRRSHQRAYASKCGGRFEGRRACMGTVVAMLKGKVLQLSGKRCSLCVGVPFMLDQCYPCGCWLRYWSGVCHVWSIT